MSASPVARQAHSHAQLIPAMRKVLISDASQMPDVYSSTPNGTIYSTTPNGKFKWERWREKKNFHVGTRFRSEKRRKFSTSSSLFCSPLHRCVYSAHWNSEEEDSSLYFKLKWKKKQKKMIRLRDCRCFLFLL